VSDPDLKALDLRSRAFKAGENQLVRSGGDRIRPSCGFLIMLHGHFNLILQNQIPEIDLPGFARPLKNLENPLKKSWPLKKKNFF
jgi:hypothetical protein